MQIPKYLVRDSNGLVVFDRVATQADGIKDWKFDEASLAAIVEYYNFILAKVNEGNSDTKISCEVSDVAIRAKCQAELTKQ